MKTILLIIGQVFLVFFAIGLMGFVLILDVVCWALDTPAYTG